MMSRAFSASADLSASLPGAPGARHDRFAAAIASLRSEERRLDRLGLRGPLLECRRQLRYWEFLRAIFTLPPAPAAARREAR